ncbi:MAG: methionyl-tRNA formyltransferase [Candidatus Omnitrophica bacterium]|nr:methionyl-tRNA formyltransferase [Candidatus Omnitrophota bacterium]
MKKRLKVSILVDDAGSWIVPFARGIQERLSRQHDTKLYFKPADVRRSDVLFLLGCTSIVPSKILRRNKHNIAVHESSLPKGRGWSPLSWQALKGEKSIPIVLFEARDKVDSGPIYMKDVVMLDGTELLPAIKQKQGKKTVEMVLRFLKRWPDVRAIEQKGKATYYRKRRAEDDMLNPRKSLIENFNRLRITDNEKYPAWFKHKGKKFKIKIYPL